MKRPAMTLSTGCLAIASLLIACNVENNDQIAEGPTETGVEIEELPMPAKAELAAEEPDMSPKEDVASGETEKDAANRIEADIIEADAGG